MRKKHQIIINLCVVSLLARSSLSWGAARTECEQCQLVLKSIQTQMQSEKIHQDLYEKNKTYLAALGPHDVSKAIKVKSNILVLILRLETLKNNIASAQIETSSKTCQLCEKAMN